MKTDLSMPELNKTETILDRREAIARSISLAKEGDIILCAGKGARGLSRNQRRETSLQRFRRI